MLRTFKEFRAAFPAARVGPRRWVHTITPGIEYPTRLDAEKGAFSRYQISGGKTP